MDSFVLPHNNTISNYFDTILNNIIKIEFTIIVPIFMQKQDENIHFKNKNFIKSKSSKYSSFFETFYLLKLSVKYIH